RRCYPRHWRKPTNRFHPLAGPVTPGYRRPDFLSPYDLFAWDPRGQIHPKFIDLWVLEYIHHFFGRRRILLVTLPYTGAAQLPAGGFVARWGTTRARTGCHRAGTGGLVHHRRQG